MPKSDRGPWIQTYTGLAFYPLSPSPDEVDIRDIAHALSMLCRYAGHTRRFYSVAEQSILIAENARPALKLMALLHDAAEAYICDIPRPLKSALSDYKTIERAVESAIRERFLIVGTQADEEEIKALDDRILEDERRVLMTEPPMPRPVREPIGVVIRFLTPEAAEAEFLRLFYRHEATL